MSKVEYLSDLIPTNWMDPLLTGPSAMLPRVGQAIEPKHIENLLRALKARVWEAEQQRYVSSEADAKDAARYRFIRDGWAKMLREKAVSALDPLTGHFPGGFDAWMDRCIAEYKCEGGEGS